MNNDNLKLLELTKKMLAVLTEIDTATEQQLAALDAEDVERFDALLDQREEMIARWEDLRGQMRTTQVVQDDDEYQVQQAPINEKIQSLSQNILQKDQRNNQRAAELLGQVRGQIQAVVAKQKSTQAYRDPGIAQQGGLYIDMKR